MSIDSEPSMPEPPPSGRRERWESECEPSRLCTVGERSGRRHLRRSAAALVLAVAVVLAGASVATAQGEGSTGTVTIVHGLRGLPVDVYVDGQLLLPAFEPDRLTEPVPLPAGDHRVELREAGRGAETEPRFGGTVTVSDGDDLAVVAHFGLDGSWTATTYDNRLDVLPAGRSALRFRNTAAAPAVDLLVDDTLAVEALDPTAERSVEVAPGGHTVQVRLEDGMPAVTDDGVAAREGEATVLYLVGRPDSGNLAWLEQTVSGLQSEPAGVPAGDSGLLAGAGDGDGGHLPAVPLATGATTAAVVAVVVGGTVLRRRGVVG